MKRFLSIILVFVLVMNLCIVATAETEKKFSDVKDDYWAKKEIEFLVNKKIINGYPNGKFGVNDPLKRVQAVAMVVKALGLKLEGRPDPGYKDIKKDFWAYKEIAAIVDEGIFVPKGNFDPNKKLTRAEMADILVNAYKLNGTFEKIFTDVPMTHWAYAPIHILAANEITTGYPDNTFKPAGDVTRTQFAVFFARVLDESFLPVAEAPKLTLAQIKKDLPKGTIKLVHEELAFWQWIQKDKAYLEALKKNLTPEAKKKIYLEMFDLTSYLYQLNSERDVIRGINYYDAVLVGKIDAITRGLQARYQLLYQTEFYEYPAVGESGSVGSEFALSHNFISQVDDNQYQFLKEMDLDLKKAIQVSSFNLDSFKHLNFYSIPFEILDGFNSYGEGELGKLGALQGIANIPGNEITLMSGSVEIFYHELGHIWEQVYLNNQFDEYLQIRNQVGYEDPEIYDWGYEISENFAEDFRYAFAPNGFDFFSTSFGKPTKELKQKFFNWVLEKEKNQKFVNQIYINGSPLSPEVITTKDGMLRLTGNMVGDLQLKVVDENFKVTESKITNSGAVNEVIKLEKEGIYDVYAENFSAKVIFDKDPTTTSFDAPVNEWMEIKKNSITKNLQDWLVVTKGRGTYTKEMKDYMYVVIQGFEWNGEKVQLQNVEVNGDEIIVSVVENKGDNHFVLLRFPSTMRDKKVIVKGLTGDYVGEDSLVDFDVEDVLIGIEKPLEGTMIMTASVRSASGKVYVEVTQAGEVLYSSQRELSTTYPHWSFWEDLIVYKGKQDGRMDVKFYEDHTKKKLIGETYYMLSSSYWD
jgi:hypothetical protein